MTTGSSATAPDLRSRLCGCLLAGAAGDVIEQVADDFHEAYHGLGVGGEYEEIDDRLSAFLARYPGY